MACKFNVQVRLGLVVELIPTPKVALDLTWILCDTQKVLMMNQQILIDRRSVLSLPYILRAVNINLNHFAKFAEGMSLEIFQYQSGKSQASDKMIPPNLPPYSQRTQSQYSRSPIRVHAHPSEVSCTAKQYIYVIPRW